MGDPLPQSIALWSRGRRGHPRPSRATCPPTGFLFLEGKLARMRRFGGIPGFFLCFSFSGGWGVVRSWPLPRERVCRLLAGCAVDGWVGGGDVKARVGLCCKVKLPGPLLQQPKEERGSERQDGGISGVFIHLTPHPGAVGGCECVCVCRGHSVCPSRHALSSRPVADSTASC